MPSLGKISNVQVEQKKMIRKNWGGQCAKSEKFKMQIDIKNVGAGQGILSP